MLTYLPHPTFKESARSLHTEDLRDSIVNGLFILDSFKSPLRSREVPVVKMWRNYSSTLILYCNTFLTELKKRHVEFGVIEDELSKYGLPILSELPPWFFAMSHEREKEQMILSHRAFLFAKRPSFYIQWGTVHVTNPILIGSYSSPVIDPIFFSH